MRSPDDPTRGWEQEPEEGGEQREAGTGAWDQSEDPLNAAAPTGPITPGTAYSEMRAGAYGEHGYGAETAYAELGSYAEGDIPPGNGGEGVTGGPGGGEESLGGPGGEAAPEETAAEASRRRAKIALAVAAFALLAVLFWAVTVLGRDGHEQPAAAPSSSPSSSALPSRSTAPAAPPPEAKACEQPKLEEQFGEDVRSRGCEGGWALLEVPGAEHSLALYRWNGERWEFYAEPLDGTCREELHGVPAALIRDFPPCGEEPRPGAEHPHDPAPGHEHDPRPDAPPPADPPDSGGGHGDETSTSVPSSSTSSSSTSEKPEPKPEQ